MEVGESRDGPAGRRRVVVKNLLVSAAGQAFGAGLNFVILVLIARYLGAERYGTYSFALAFVGVFQLLASAGLDQILVREITVSPRDAPRLVGVAKSLTWLLSLATFALILGVVQLSSLAPTVRLATAIVGAGAIATIHAIVLGAVFRAFERMEVNALAFVLHKVVFLVAAAVAAWVDSGLIGMCVAFLIANVCNWGYHFVVLSTRHFRPALRADVRLWRALLVESIPLGFAALLRRVSWHVDVLILMAFGMTHAVGYFTAGYKVVQAFNLVPLTVAQVLFPALSRTGRTLPPAFEAMTRRTVRCLVLLALPLTVGIAFSANRIVALAYGAGFAPAGPALVITGLSVPFLFVTSLYPFVFTAMGAQRRFTLAALGAVVVNVLVDLVLVPRLAELGASIGTVAGEVTLFVAGSVWLHRANRGPSWVATTWRPLTAALAMAGFLVILPRFVDSAVAVWTLGMVVYVGALLVLRAVRPGELASLWRVTRDALRSTPFRPVSTGGVTSEVRGRV